MKNVNKIKFKVFSDCDGDLIPIEFANFSLFKIKRIFTVSNVPKGEIRGNHAHYKTKQFLICISGKIQVFLDNGNYQQEIIIEKGEGVFVDKFIWDYQKFLTGKDFMLVLCSTKYDKLDYIEDKKSFYSLVENKK